MKKNTKVIFFICLITLFSMFFPAQKTLAADVEYEKTIEIPYSSSNIISITSKSQTISSDDLMYEPAEGYLRVGNVPSGKYFHSLYKVGVEKKSSASNRNGSSGIETSQIYPGELCGEVSIYNTSDEDLYIVMDRNTPVLISKNIDSPTIIAISSYESTSGADTYIGKFCDVFAPGQISYSSHVENTHTRFLPFTSINASYNGTINENRVPANLTTYMEITSPMQDFSYIYTSGSTKTFVTSHYGAIAHLPFGMLTEENAGKDILNVSSNDYSAGTYTYEVFGGLQVQPLPLISGTYNIADYEAERTSSSWIFSSDTPLDFYFPFSTYDTFLNRSTLVTATIRGDVIADFGNSIITDNNGTQTLYITDNANPITKNADLFIPENFSVTSISCQSSSDITLTGLTLDNGVIPWFSNKYVIYKNCTINNLTIASGSKANTCGKTYQGCTFGDIVINTSPQRSQAQLTDCSIDNFIANYSCNWICTNCQINYFKKNNSSSPSFKECQIGELDDYYSSHLGYIKDTHITKASFHQTSSSPRTSPSSVICVNSYDQTPPSNTIDEIYVDYPAEFDASDALIGQWKTPIDFSTPRRMYFNNKESYYIYHVESFEDVTFGDTLYGIFTDTDASEWDVEDVHTYAYFGSGTTLPENIDIVSPSSYIRLYGATENTLTFDCELKIENSSIREIRAPKITAMQSNISYIATDSLCFTGGTHDLTISGNMSNLDESTLVENSGKTIVSVSDTSENSFGNICRLYALLKESGLDVELEISENLYVVYMDMFPYVNIGLTSAKARDLSIYYPSESSYTLYEDSYYHIPYTSGEPQILYAKTEGYFNNGENLAAIPLCDEFMGAFYIPSTKTVYITSGLAIQPIELSALNEYKDEIENIIVRTGNHIRLLGGAFNNMPNVSYIRIEDDCLLTLNSITSLPNLRVFETCGSVTPTTMRNTNVVTLFENLEKIDMAQMPEADLSFVSSKPCHIYIHEPWDDTHMDNTLSNENMAFSYYKNIHTGKYECLNPEDLDSFFEYIASLRNDSEVLIINGLEYDFDTVENTFDPSQFNGYIDISTSYTPYNYVPVEYILANGTEKYNGKVFELTLTEDYSTLKYIYVKEEPLSSETDYTRYLNNVNGVMIVSENIETAPSCDYATNFYTEESYTRENFNSYRIYLGRQINFPNSCKLFAKRAMGYSGSAPLAKSEVPIIASYKLFCNENSSNPYYLLLDAPEIIVPDTAEFCFQNIYYPDIPITFEGQIPIGCFYKADLTNSPYFTETTNDKDIDILFRGTASSSSMSSFSFKMGRDGVLRYSELANSGQSNANIKNAISTVSSATKNYYINSFPYSFTTFIDVNDGQTISGDITSNSENVLYRCNGDMTFTPGSATSPMTAPEFNSLVTGTLILKCDRPAGKHVANTIYIMHPSGDDSSLITRGNTTGAFFTNNFSCPLSGNFKSNASYSYYSNKAYFLTTNPDVVEGTTTRGKTDTITKIIPQMPTTLQEIQSFYTTALYGSTMVTTPIKYTLNGVVKEFTYEYRSNSTVYLYQVESSLLQELTKNGVNLNDVRISYPLGESASIPNSSPVFSVDNVTKFSEIPEEDFLPFVNDFSSGKYAIEGTKLYIYFENMKNPDGYDPNFSADTNGSFDKWLNIPGSNYSEVFIKIADEVEEIPSFFYCNIEDYLSVNYLDLSSDFYLPNSIKKINDYAFYVNNYISGLPSEYLPEDMVNLEYIGKNNGITFPEDEYGNVHLPNNLKYLATSSLSGQYNAVFFPESLEYADTNALNSIYASVIFINSNFDYNETSPNLIQKKITSGYAAPSNMAFIDAYHTDEQQSLLYNEEENGRHRNYMHLKDTRTGNDFYVPGGSCNGDARQYGTSDGDRYEHDINLDYIVKNHPIYMHDVTIDKNTTNKQQGSLYNEIGLFLQGTDAFTLLYYYYINNGTLTLLDGDPIDTTIHIAPDVENVAIVSRPSPSIYTAIDGGENVQKIFYQNDGYNILTFYGKPTQIINDSAAYNSVYNTIMDADGCEHSTNDMSAYYYYMALQDYIKSGDYANDITIENPCPQILLSPTASTALKNFPYERYGYDVAIDDVPISIACINQDGTTVDFSALTIPYNTSGLNADNWAARKEDLINDLYSKNLYLKSETLFTDPERRHAYRPFRGIKSPTSLYADTDYFRVNVSFMDGESEVFSQDGVIRYSDLTSIAPAVTKPLRTFAGWYIDPELTTPLSNFEAIDPNNPDAYTGSLTLYAKWDGEINYTVNTENSVAPGVTPKAQYSITPSDSRTQLKTSLLSESTKSIIEEGDLENANVNWVGDVSCVLVEDNISNDGSHTFAFEITLKENLSARESGDSITGGAVTETPAPLCFSMDLPGDYDEEKNDIHLFRDHNGVVEELPVEVTNRTAHFSSDLFSKFTFKIVKKGETVTPPKTTPTTPTTDTTPTSTTTKTDNGSSSTPKTDNNSSNNNNVSSNKTQSNTPAAETPKTTSSARRTPKTGDDTPLGMLILSLIVSSIVVSISLVTFKKKKRNNK